MGYGFTLDDVAFLRSPAGVEALADASGRPLSSATMLSDIAALRRRHPSRDGLLIETVLCRRRGRRKLRDADRMLFTDDALQQATASKIAHFPAASASMASRSLRGMVRKLMLGTSVGGSACMVSLAVL